MGEDRDRPDDQSSDADIDNDIIDIGTDPVGESADPVYDLGTDTVIGSQPPRDDTVYMIGTEPVGKSADYEDIEASEIPTEKD